MSNIFKNLLVALKGFAMGAANVIPGVSGGTIALLTGIFNELVDAIDSALSISSWKLLLKGQFKEFWKAVHGTFLFWLAIGLAISIFSLAKVMEYVLAYHPVQTWSFFFGLILVSSFFLLGELPKKDAVRAQKEKNLSASKRAASEGWQARDVLWLLIGVVIGIVICKLSPTTTPDTWWFVLICGAIAICAMILPGISGSFLLVLLGKYEYIMSAISNLDWPVLFIFGFGCLLGIGAFTKLLNWLIARYERTTLLVLIGFTLGSLIKVWPWSDKVSVATAQLMRSGQSAEEARQGVQMLVDSGIDISTLFNPQIGSAICWMLTGAVLVLALEWVSKVNSK